MLVPAVARQRAPAQTPVLIVRAGLIGAIEIVDEVLFQT